MPADEPARREGRAAGGNGQNSVATPTNGGQIVCCVCRRHGSGRVFTDAPPGIRRRRYALSRVGRSLLAEIVELVLQLVAVEVGEGHHVEQQLNLRGDAAKVLAG